MVINLNKELYNSENNKSREQEPKQISNPQRYGLTYIDGEAFIGSQASWKAALKAP